MTSDQVVEGTPLSTPETNHARVTDRRTDGAAPRAGGGGDKARRVGLVPGRPVVVAHLDWLGRSWPRRPSAPPTDHRRWFAGGISELIKGVLLDVGDTLIQPRGGRWNPRLDFEDILATFGITYDDEHLAAAIAVGNAYLNRMAARGSRDDYHRAILEVLGVEPDPDLLAALDHPRPFRELIEVFPDVPRSLQRLREWNLALGIVSDTGREARRLYAEFGWNQFFGAFAISAELGCCKPDPRMYRTASDALGLRPEDCLFVDNDQDCLQGALDLGYQVCGISRYSELPPSAAIPWVADLDGVLALVRPLTKPRSLPVSASRPRPTT